MKKFSFLFLIFLTILAGCTEYYEPNTDETGQVLVVQGLITNMQEGHFVYLSLSGSFNGSKPQKPVSQAVVYVTDEHRIKHMFAEQSPGYYVSSSGFKGKIGHSYTLFIETTENHVYISKPQKIMPPAEIDTLYSSVKTLDLFLPDNNGEMILNSIEGIELSAEIESPSGGYPMFRFDPEMLVQYLRYIYTNPEDPDIEFCRTRKKLNDLTNVTVPGVEGLTGDKIYHPVTFVPFERKHFKGSFIDGTINRRILILRQYSLNNDSYQFYKKMNEQLKSENTIFDPAAVQLPGNIICKTDPSRPALGFFEASAFSSCTYKIGPEPLRTWNIIITKINDLNYLPENDCSFEKVPADWVY